MKTTVSGFHEEFGRDVASEPSSDRAFGLVFAGAFAVIGLLPLFSANPVRRWALVAAAIFLAFAAIAPRLLAPLNGAWMWIGAKLHRVVSPIALLLLFVGFCVVGWANRRRVRSTLGLSFDATRDSYWVKRDPPGPAPATMHDQY
jgi:hypothetical protein